MIRGCAILGLVWVALGGTARAASPAELLAAVRSPRLDASAVTRVEGVEVEMGQARLRFERGFLFPSRLPDGRVVEALFIGQARFLSEPADEIESAQLELFTGRRVLDVAVDSAIVTLADEAAFERLVAGPAVDPRPEVREQAAALYEDWLAGPWRRQSEVAGFLFNALVGDAAYRKYFAVRCSSFEIGEFMYRFEPEEVEQLLLARYDEPELSFRRRIEVRRFLRIQQRKGRFLDTVPEDMGNWDVWGSTSWRDEEGRKAGGAGFEARHYELDLTLTRRLELQGRARIELTAQSAGRRVVRMSLHPDARVDRVAAADGRPLFHFRSGDRLSVLLPDAPENGERLAVEVLYRGRLLTPVDGLYHELADSAAWHPHAGTLDRATYDVTFRRPRRYQLFASGIRVDGGRDGTTVWERRKLDIPAIALSFTIGRFDVERADVDGTELTVGFSRSRKLRTSPEARAKVVETAARSLRFFEETFGPYPLDELNVVIVPRRYSQSYLGFVTLARSVVGYDGSIEASADWVREMTIAHEVAHQWWGNLVGWWSYRDQWLSEAMANYSALLYDARSSPDGSLLTVMSSGWREPLSRTTLDGRPVESVGPVVLGNRLNSSRAGDAYRPIVYRKGAVVLAMIGRVVGEERFLEMLRAIADGARGHVLTTESFLTSIEKMSDLDLDGFAQQYIYGTGIPQIYYDYRAEPLAEGGWRLSGTADRLDDPSFRYRIVSRGPDELELLRTPSRGPGTDAGGSLDVPFRLREDDRARWREGKLRLDRDHQTFRIPTAGRPGSLELDPRGELLANFYSAERSPKRFLRCRAQDLARAGRTAEAEQSYLSALEASSSTPPGPSGPLFHASRSRVEDTRIRLALVRLWIETARPDRARAALEQLEADLRDSDRELLRVERDVLWSRLELLDGEATAARKRLRRVLRQAEPREGMAGSSLLRQIRLNAERAAITEAFGLLVVASHRSGKLEDLEWASREAHKRGIRLPSILLP